MAERVAYLRAAFAASGVALLAAALVAGLVAGWAGVAGIAAGIGIVAASYTATTLAVAWADMVNPRMVLAVGMAMYISKYSLLGLVLVVVEASGWPGTIPMAIGIVVGVVVWIAAQIWWARRHLHPYVRQS